MKEKRNSKNGIAANKNYITYSTFSLNKN